MKVHLVLLLAVLCLAGVLNFSAVGRSYAGWVSIPHRPVAEPPSRTHPTYLPFASYRSNETLNNYQGLLLRVDQNGHNLFTMRADRTGRRAITTLHDEAIGTTLWSPQNDLVALSTVYTNTLRIAVLDGSGDSVVYTSTNDIEPLAWSPDQRWLAFRTYDSFGNSVTFNLLDTSDHSVTPLEGVISPPISWSPDGNTLLYHIFMGLDVGNTIWVADADGANPRRLTVDDTGIAFLKWMSGGAQFLAKKWEEGNTQQVIYLYNADGTRERELIRLPAYSDAFLWTLAPTQIAVAYPRDKSSDLSRMYVQYEGSTPIPISDAFCDRDTKPYCGVAGAKWSPTSQQVAYNTGDADPTTPYDAQLWVVPLTPTPTIPTTPVAQNLGVHAWLNDDFLMVIEATISPDPRAVGVLHPASGTYERISPSDGTYWDSIEWRPVP